jgi:hypothetical protein
MLAGRDPLDARFKRIQYVSLDCIGVQRTITLYKIFIKNSINLYSPKRVICLKLPARGKFSERIGFARRISGAV